MKIVIGSDHAGFPLKEDVRKFLLELHHRVLDVGTYSPDPVDYPDFAEAVSKAVLNGKGERGIVICGSGVGAVIAANKMRGIRACLCHDTYSAHQGVEHDNMNVLGLGARVIGDELARELVRAFVSAKFSGEERHVRRLNKVLDIESSKQ